MFLKRLLTILCVLLGGIPAVVHAFCGFYVARADTKLFNQASQVVLARVGDRTVITMSNDFQGDVSEFAVVVPVPTFIERQQIHVTEQAIVDHLDAYTAPRLVEYFDTDPCAVGYLLESDAALPRTAAAPPEREARARSLGVTVEASYTVGEYDILILAAQESDGLITWLEENDYRLPPGAGAVVGSYLKQGMRFFVAKVNLREKARLGFANLRPLQVAFESPKFMLPIRLGMVNANGPQELYLYALTRKGRVETTNYRTVELPTGMEIPSFVKSDFGNFYRSLFRKQTEEHQQRAVFLEYAWDMAWCDPCAADPLSHEELRQLGVYWATPNRAAQNVFVTRLHLRYDKTHFPEDLMFHETGDRNNFQGRYVIRHAWTGPSRCPAADRYITEELPRRRQRQARTLSALTGWEAATIQARMPAMPALDTAPWWQRLWTN